MNEYRVDRAQEGLTPVGMNSILYIGSSYYDACVVYKASVGGKDPWNEPNRSYGVMLSRWVEDKHQYTVMRWKSV